MYTPPGGTLGVLTGSWLTVFVVRVLCCAVPLGLQPAKVACIEYPRDAGKDEQYPWVCLWKAVSVADSILGARAQVGSAFSGSACPQHIRWHPETVHGPS